MTMPDQPSTLDRADGVLASVAAGVASSVLLVSAPTVAFGAFAAGSVTSVFFEAARLTTAPVAALERAAGMGATAGFVLGGGLVYAAYRMFKLAPRKGIAAVSAAAFIGTAAYLLPDDEPVVQPDAPVSQRVEVSVPKMVTASKSAGQAPVAERDAASEPAQTTDGNEPSPNAPTENLSKPLTRTVIHARVVIDGKVYTKDYDSDRDATLPVKFTCDSDGIVTAQAGAYTVIPLSKTDYVLGTPDANRLVGKVIVDQPGYRVVKQVSDGTMVRSLRDACASGPARTQARKAITAFIDSLRR